MKFLGFMWNPLSWVMEAAAIMAIALANGGVSFIDFVSMGSCLQVSNLMFVLYVCRGSRLIGRTLWELLFFW